MFICGVLAVACGSAHTSGWPQGQLSMGPTLQRAVVKHGACGQKQPPYMPFHLRVDTYLYTFSRLTRAPLPGRIANPPFHRCQKAALRAIFWSILLVDQKLLVDSAELNCLHIVVCLIRACDLVLLKFLCLRKVPGWLATLASVSATIQNTCRDTVTSPTYAVLLIPMLWRVGLDVCVGCLF